MAKRPVELDDILKFNIVGECAISPQSRTIAYTVTCVDRSKNRYRTRIWIAAVDRNAQPVTSAVHSSNSPAWSPGGSFLAFVSDREDSGDQIYLLPLAGGEAEQLTKLPEGSIGSIKWSPDGKQIGFQFTASPAEYTKKAKKVREEKKLSSPVRVHERLFYRLDGHGYFDGEYSQIAVVNVKSGRHHLLTQGPFGCGDFCWSPNSQEILFSSNRRDDRDLRPDRDDLWRVDITGGDLRRVQAPVGPKESCAWSPDGKWIAWIGNTDPDDTWGCRNERVLLIPAAGAAEAVDVTGDSDMAVGYLSLSDMHSTGGLPLQWDPQSDKLYFPVSSSGTTRLYRCDLSGANLQPLTPIDRELCSYSLDSSGIGFGCILGTCVAPAEAYLGFVQGSRLELRRVGDANRGLMSKVALSAPRPFQTVGSDAYTVHGWVLTPPNLRGKPAPCVLYVHGGPALQYGGAASPFHELQWLAAQGYVVVFSNPRGSKGYGEEHTSAIKGDWGNKDWIDIQAVADYAASLPEVDSARMAIMGGSYGGYMTMWAIGHTNRFRCAVADRMVGNVHSMAGTSDFPWEHGKFYKGNAWDDPSDLWRVSPLKFAGSVETPLLIIHSDGDLRCPVSQSEELFAALRSRGKEVEFVRYPAETSHGLSRSGPPDMRVDRLKRNIAWLNRHLK